MKRNEEHELKVAKGSFFSYVVTWEGVEWWSSHVVIHTKS